MKGTGAVWPWVSGRAHLCLFSGDVALHPLLTSAAVRGGWGFPRGTVANSAQIEHLLSVYEWYLCGLSDAQAAEGPPGSDADWKEGGQQGL